MHPALNNSKVLSKVFDYLEEDEDSLRAVIQVNKKWFDCGTSVLWKCAPTKRLARLPDHRRQVYASHMQSLDLWGEKSAQYHEAFKDLSFPSLTRLSVSDSHDPGNPLFAAPYIQPSLENFVYCGNKLCPALLDLLRMTCKSLKRFVVYSLGPHITAPFFLEFLQSYPSIERIVLLDDSKDVITDELLLHLSERDNLTSLHLNREIDEFAIDDIAMGIASPFKSLQDLVISVPSSAVPMLLEMIKSTITSLSLAVQDSPAGVLEQVSRLPQLRDFHMSAVAPSGSEISASEIFMLRHLVKLEHLSIMAPANLPPLIVDDISDQDFGLLIMHLPLLKALVFRAECHLSERALERISRYCPDLTYLSLMGPFHLAALDLDTRPEPMFPNLTEFVFDGILDSCWARRCEWVGDMEAFGLARMIRFHFPKLKRLSGGDDYYTDRIRAAWETLKKMGDTQLEDAD